PGAAVSPGRRPAIAVPARTCDYVVAVGQGGDTLAPQLITGVAADEGTQERPTQPIKQIHSASLAATEVIIGFRHNHVAIAQDRDTGAKAAACRGMRVNQIELREDTGRSIADDDILGIEEQRTALA